MENKLPVHENLRENIFGEMQPFLWLSGQEATIKNCIRSIWKHTA